MIRIRLTGAALSVLALGSLAWAGDASVGSPDAQQSVLQPMAVPMAFDDTAPGQTGGPAGPTDVNAPTAGSPAAPNAPTPTPIMQSDFGNWLNQYQLNLTGYVEGGWYDNLTQPASDVGKRTFAGDKTAYAGAYKNQIILDQVDLAFSRTIDPTKGNFDIGFMIEGNYGRDSFFDHSNGMFDNYNKTGGGPDDEPDLEQAYITIGIPLDEGKGLTVTAGKFDALYGYETINPTQDQFYTHSYIYTFGTPLTQTGVTVAYNLEDNLIVKGGISRGWSESTDDNNGAIDGIWQVVYTSDEKLDNGAALWTLTSNGSFGPEGSGTIPYGPKDNSNYWVVPELIGTYQVSDEFKLALDGLYGYANSESQWYAAALYGSYAFNDFKYLTLNGRVEWYNDGRGLTTGVPVTTNYGEATVGVQIKPFPDSNIFQFLQFRPEVRYDIASRSVFQNKAQELSVAVDAIMQF